MVVVMYVTIPVSKGTKRKVDYWKKALGLKTYDETIAALAKKNPIAVLEKWEGVLAGAPEFKRDSLERNIG